MRFLQNAGLPQIVAYNKKMVTEAHMVELHQALSEAINGDPPLPVEEVIELVLQKRKEQELPDSEVIQVRLTCALSCLALAHSSYPLPPFCNRLLICDL